MDSSPHRVGDVMTRAAVAVGRRALFKDIVERMYQWQVSALPVLEGDGRVIGVISEADLLPKEEFRNSDPDRFTQLRRLPDLAKAGAACAEELMTAPAVTVHADAGLAEAARIMALRHVKRLPVVNAEGMLEGVVSRGDLLKVFLRPDNELADEIRRDILDVLFPAPIEPVHVVVTDGVVVLTGRVEDASRVPLATRLVRGVEGVVGVECHLTAADVA
ncbi:CBS domain-containing protein [Streptomyces sp. 1222.5]|uniref:CBS domain-containing protein n=1 Tax=unclassified Streptomyces TaxID=2593676 RepID=UPI00089AB34E|nr:MULTISPECIES: CBS domain-containing protein [unclassified Streptomyces]PKW05436.1 CBS domain protein [Streptomyces sp. 5112.2]SEC16008.1 CBS domain-containing protein [Streptomyces sp. 2231.1]SED39643.1 CBS domain-containing protein [Streptomyces sp. 1222.5]